MGYVTCVGTDDEESMLLAASLDEQADSRSEVTAPNRTQNA